MSKNGVTHRDMPTSSDVRGTLSARGPTEPEPEPQPEKQEPISRGEPIGLRATLGCVISGLCIGLAAGFLGVLGLSLTGFLGTAPAGEPTGTVAVQEPAQPKVVARPEFPLLVTGEVYQVERATSLASEYLGEPTQTLPEGGYLRVGECNLEGLTPWYIVYVSDGIQTYPMWIDAAWLKNQRLIRVPSPPS